MKLYTIFDKKAVAYSQPFFAHNKGLAIRQFEQLVNDPQTTLNKYPTDFSIWEIGAFDTVTGILTGHSKPQPVEEANNVYKKAEKNG